MENAISKFLDAVIPKIGDLLSNMKFWMGFLMIAGPVLMLLFGAYYFFLSPKEANHKAGYRTYFGMGSVQVWRFTQRLDGVVFGGMCILLTILGIIGCVVMSSGNPLNAADKALVFIIIQLALSVAAYLFVEIFVAMHYDKEGNPKK